MTPPAAVEPEHARRALARSTLLAFLFTFIAARTVTFLIMARRLPDLYLHVGGTHVHHLTYGIFLLVAVGAYLLFVPGPRQHVRVIAILYGIGLALTFDEFGMWLHLGGPYWQRASFDAIIVLGALLGLLAFMPPLRVWRTGNLRTALIVLLATAVFYYLLIGSLRFAAEVAPRLEELEQHAPS